MSLRNQQIDPKSLKHLVRLYELRENKARADYQEQLNAMKSAQETFDRREADHNVVLTEADQLRIAAYSEELSSNVRAQQRIQVKRKWLKYDSEKTQYFLNDARCDLSREKEETTRKRQYWMQLKNRREQFEKEHRVSVKACLIARETHEEREQEDDALNRYLGGSQYD